MTDATRAELQALSTRAAILEAQRQSALTRQDTAAAYAIETELSRLWARYLAVERSVA